MDIILTARHSNIPDSTRDYAKEKSEKLTRFYSLRKIEIIMDVVKDNYNVEVVASPERAGSLIIGKAKTSEWFSAIEQAHDKVERQLRKLKEKEKSHRVKKFQPESFANDEGYQGPL